MVSLFLICYPPTRSIMPRCEGRPDGPCPAKVNNSSVVLSQGDLMLCRDCEQFRFPYMIKATNTAVPHRDGTALSKTAPREHDTPLTSLSAASSVSADAKGSRASSTRTRQLTDVNGSESRTVLLAGPLAYSDGRAYQKVILNEILSYLHFYRDCANADALRRVVLGFYTAEDITDAKKLLVHELQAKVSNCQFLTERRNSTARTASEAEVDDILGIFDTADGQQALDNYLFVSSNLNQLPKYGPEELNIGAVVDRQVRIESRVDAVNARIDQITSVHDDNSGIMTAGVQSRFDLVHCAITEQLNKLTSVVDQLSAASSTAQSAPDRETRDRSMNVIMFGVPEHRDVSVWRQSVMDAIQHVAGRVVDTDDMFRIGRYGADKTRPVIVRLRSTWDRRLILSNCYKLRNYRERVFIKPDESVETRRKRSFDQLKRQAEHDGKTVSVVNGTLTVDGIDVFSLRQGPITHQSS